MTQPKKLTSDQEKHVDDYLRKAGWECLLPIGEDEYLRFYNTFNFQIYLLFTCLRQIGQALAHGFKGFLRGGDR